MAVYMAATTTIVMAAIMAASAQTILSGSTGTSAIVADPA